VSLAGAQLLGQDALAGLDRVRADTAGRVLSVVPTPASTTAGSLARRFGPGQLAGVEAGLARLVDRWLGLLPARLRSPLGGVLAQQGKVPLWLVFVLGSAGSIVGDSIGYEVGRRYRDRLLRRLPR
jgi:hypothetical protein